MNMTDNNKPADAIKKSVGRPKGSTTIDGECKLPTIRIPKLLMEFLEEEAQDKGTFVTQIVRSTLLDTMKKKRKAQAKLKSNENSD